MKIPLCPMRQLDCLLQYLVSAFILLGTGNHVRSKHARNHVETYTFICPSLVSSWILFLYTHMTSSKPWHFAQNRDQDTLHKLISTLPLISMASHNPDTLGCTRARSTPVAVGLRCLYTLPISFSNLLECLLFLCYLRVLGGGLFPSGKMPNNNHQSTLLTHCFKCHRYYSEIEDSSLDSRMMGTPRNLPPVLPIPIFMPSISERSELTTTKSAIIPIKHSALYALVHRLDRIVHDEVIFVLYSFSRII